MLELYRLCKRFAGITAVDDVSFVARAGEVTGYLGPNGSGKSTTMKIITGLLQASAGEVRLDGRRVDEDWAGFKQQMGYVPEEPNLYSHLSATEYLTMVGQLRDLPAKPTVQRIDGMLELLGLHADRHAPISTYSKGMQQKVLICAALLHNPDVVLFDEPFSGLDAETALVLRSLLTELANRGKVVLFSSHELDVVERICSRVVILHRGRVVANDSVENLRVALHAPSLEVIFQQVADQRDTSLLSRQMADLISS